MDRDNSLLAFLLGATVGAVFGLLYAPKTGKETREHLKKLTEDFVEDAEEVGNDLREKGKRFVNDSKVKVSELVEKGKAKFKKQGVAADGSVEALENEDEVIEE
mgnify:CR=1 FL=1